MDELKAGGYGFHPVTGVGGVVKAIHPAGTWCPTGGVSPGVPLTVEVVEFEDGNVVINGAEPETTVRPLKELEAMFIRQMHAVVAHMATEAVPLARALGLDLPTTSKLLRIVFSGQARALGGA